MRLTHSLTENFKSREFNLCGPALRSHSHSALGFIFNGFSTCVPDVSKRDPDSVQARDYFWCAVNGRLRLEAQQRQHRPVKRTKTFSLWVKYPRCLPACLRGLVALLHTVSIPAEIRETFERAPLNHSEELS